MSSDEDTTMDPEPCILISSCDPGFKEEELIKQILGTSTLPEPSKQENTVIWYPWTISNKYYTAGVSLCVVPIVNRKLHHTHNANSFWSPGILQKDGLSSVSSWLPIVEDLAPEVLILACDHVCDDGVGRQEAQQWCLAHAFELVELSPQDLPDEDDDFPESTGVKRIVQALNANVWASAEMKDGDHNQGFGLMSSLVAARHNNPRPSQDTQSSGSPIEIAEESPAEQRTVRTEGDGAPQGANIMDPMTDMDIQELATLTAGDADVENFERLFTKLKEMKDRTDKASSLPHEQRKVHAEKVAKAFWMAIGGDQDEIDGLSSGEES
ncbi:alpha- and gamma-adaptin-binding protein p34 isoform X2 [Clupea harengus]|uniref:Alpha- and gamma-adaptin-binding protein p34 isoform X2 n=1 Tax=Clupea harengus TaxID=7950 RepID=A0A6P8F6L4_CLUHA|nr:alpha- and gamma-adaptin-binding protein p34 isoform X2 [Clupea harengus]